jgi:hypothetical protein
MTTPQIDKSLEIAAADIKLQFVADIVSPFVNSPVRYKPTEDATDIYNEAHLKKLLPRELRAYKKGIKYQKEIRYDAVDLSTGEELLIPAYEIYEEWFNRNSFYLERSQGFSEFILYIRDIRGTTISILTQLSNMSRDELAAVLTSNRKYEYIGYLINLLFLPKYKYESRGSAIIRSDKTPLIIDDTIIFDRKVYKIIAEPIISDWYHPQAISLFQIRLRVFLSQLVYRSIPDNIRIITKKASIKLNSYAFKLAKTWLKFIKSANVIAVGRYVTQQLEKPKSMKYIEKISNKLYQRSIAIRDLIIEFSSVGKQSECLNNVKSSSLFEPQLLRCIVQFLDISPVIPNTKKIEDWIISYVNKPGRDTDIVKSFHRSSIMKKISLPGFKLLVHSLKMDDRYERFSIESDSEDEDANTDNSEEEEDY